MKDLTTGIQSEPRMKSFSSQHSTVPITNHARPIMEARPEVAAPLATSEESVYCRRRGLGVQG